MRISQAENFFDKLSLFPPLGVQFLRALGCVADTAQIESLFPIRSSRKQGLGHHKKCGACVLTRVQIFITYALSDFRFAHIVTPPPLPFPPLKKLRFDDSPVKKLSLLLKMLRNSTRT